MGSGSPSPTQRRGVSSSISRCRSTRSRRATARRASGARSRRCCAR